MAGDWRTRMDDLKQRRIAAGRPVQIGRGENTRASGSAPPFDYKADLAEFPFNWMPVKPDDLHLLPDPLRTWSLEAMKQPAPPRRRTGKSTRITVTVNQRREAVARHRAGESYAVIAAELGVTKSAVRNWCSRPLPEDRESFIEQLNTPGELAA